MCFTHILSHNHCLLTHAMASEYFDGQCLTTDQPKLQLRKTLHALLPFGPGPVFNCPFRWCFLRQFISMTGASVSSLRVEMVPIDIVNQPLLAKHQVHLLTQFCLYHMCATVHHHHFLAASSSSSTEAEHQWVLTGAVAFVPPSGAETTPPTPQEGGRCLSS